jgi:hypothetical protein
MIPDTARIKTHRADFATVAGVPARVIGWRKP